MNSGEVVVAAVVVEVGGAEPVKGTYVEQNGDVQLSGGFRKYPNF